MSSTIPSVKERVMYAKEPEKEVIHSGHFMVSDFEADDEDDVALPFPEESVDVKVGKPKSGKLSKVTFQDTSMSPMIRPELSIETSLTKLFQCMSLAYRQKLTSPKWNRFKGIRLRWKDKIRLNNVIWRCWHMQFVNRKRTLVCQFASPLDIDTHNKPEAIVMEGKYWKRRLHAVTAEYKKWRMFHRNRLLGKKDGQDMIFDLESLEWPGSVKDSSDLMIDEEYMMLMTDTLFNTMSANQPFAFPDHREIARGASLADFIQPSLVQLQPNLDDFMDLEPFQELLPSKISLEGCDDTMAENKLPLSGASSLAATVQNEVVDTGWPSTSGTADLTLNTSAPTPPSQLNILPSIQLAGQQSGYIIKRPPITTTTNVYPLYKGGGAVKVARNEILSGVDVKNESREFESINESSLSNDKTSSHGPLSPAGSPSWKDLGQVSSPSPPEVHSPGTTIYRRGCHVNAEQKRRCNIKNGFDILFSLLPQSVQNSNSKVSKAGVLQKAVAYIKQLRAERMHLEEEIKALRTQVDFHNAAISNCQDKLPATGIPISKAVSTKIMDMFRHHVKQRTNDNWKYWIFSLICEPLMITFSECVSSVSMDHLFSTTLQWVDQYCSLILLRPIVLNTLRRLCTTTDVLSDPEQLEKEAINAVKNYDGPSSSSSFSADPT